MAAPMPKEAISEPSTAVETAKAIEPQVKPSEAPEQPETKPEAPKKVEDPNNCEPERYWSKEPPHECIDKPKMTNPSADVASTQSAPVSAPSGGNCDSWKAAAGIPNTYATNKLINNESGCDPSVYNRAGSGACGIPQALPCSKLTVDAGCSLDSAGAVCQLRWMDNYVKNRYNTWEGALSFWHCIGHCSSNLGTVYKTTNWY